MKTVDCSSVPLPEVSSTEATYQQIIEPEPEFVDVRTAQQLTNAAPDPCPCQCKGIIYTGL